MLSKLFHGLKEWHPFFSLTQCCFSRPQMFCHRRLPTALPTFGRCSRSYISRSELFYVKFWGVPHISYTIFGCTIGGFPMGKSSHPLHLAMLAVRVLQDSSKLWQASLGAPCCGSTKNDQVRYKGRGFWVELRKISRIRGKEFWDSRYHAGDWKKLDILPVQ